MFVKDSDVLHSTVKTKHNYVENRYHYTFIILKLVIMF